MAIQVRHLLEVYDGEGVCAFSCSQIYAGQIVSDSGIQESVNLYDFVLDAYLFKRYSIISNGSCDV